MWGGWWYGRITVVSQFIPGMHVLTCAPCSILYSTEFFLTWITQRGHVLGCRTQQSIDTWVSDSTQPERRNTVRGVVTAKMTVNPPSLRMHYLQTVDGMMQENVRSKIRWPSTSSQSQTSPRTEKERKKVSTSHRDEESSHENRVGNLCASINGALRKRTLIICWALVFFTYFLRQNNHKYYLVA